MRCAFAGVIAFRSWSVCSIWSRPFVHFQAPNRRYGTSSKPGADESGQPEHLAAVELEREAVEVAAGEVADADVDLLVGQVLMFGRQRAEACGR